MHSILRVRALEYKLNPELESACRSQLGLYCSDFDLIGKGDVSYYIFMCIYTECYFINFFILFCNSGKVYSL